MNLDSFLTDALVTAARQDGRESELRFRALVEREESTRGLHAALQGELARNGLTEAGFGLLVVLLANEPAAVLRSDLGTAAGLSPMRTANALTRLEMSHLVSRQRDGRDRRLIWLRLTDEGRIRASDAIRHYIAASVRITESLDLPELTASISISSKLRSGAEGLCIGDAVNNPET